MKKADFALLHRIPKNDFTLNLSDRKIKKFPHCDPTAVLLHNAFPQKFWKPFQVLVWSSEYKERIHFRQCLMTISSEEIDILLWKWFQLKDRALNFFKDFSILKMVLKMYWK